VYPCTNAPLHGHACASSREQGRSIEELRLHGRPPVGFLDYLATGHFLSATFENWESEFLRDADPPQSLGPAALTLLPAQRQKELDLLRGNRRVVRREVNRVQPPGDHRA
jgi:hypothetical protein